MRNNCNCLNSFGFVKFYKFEMIIIIMGDSFFDDPEAECVYRNHMKECSGVDLAEHEVLDLKNIVEAAFYFPGFKRSQINADLNGGILEIHAKKGGDKRYFCYALPKEIDEVSIDLFREDGLVELIMPKKK